VEGTTFQITHDTIPGEPYHYCVGVNAPGGPFHAFGDTAPLAIVRCYLLSRLGKPAGDGGEREAT
jgi:hypothetical protein